MTVAMAQFHRTSLIFQLFPQASELLSTQCIRITRGTFKHRGCRRSGIMLLFRTGLKWYRASKLMNELLMPGDRQREIWSNIAWRPAVKPMQQISFFYSIALEVSHRIISGSRRRILFNRLYNLLISLQISNKLPYINSLTQQQKSFLFQEIQIKFNKSYQL